MLFKVCSWRVGGSMSVAVSRLQYSHISKRDSHNKISIGQPWMGFSFLPLAKDRRKALLPDSLKWKSNQQCGLVGEIKVLVRMA